jgi:V8-like Glu-specific endopeptidase
MSEFRLFKNQGKVTDSRKEFRFRVLQTSASKYSAVVHISRDAPSTEIPTWQ